MKKTLLVGAIGLMLMGSAHAGCYSWDDTVTLTGKLVRRYDKNLKKPFVGLLLKKPICLNASADIGPAHRNQVLLSFGDRTEQEGSGARHFGTRLRQLLGHTVTVTGRFDNDPIGHTPLSLELSRLEPAGRRG